MDGRSSWPPTTAGRAVRDRGRRRAERHGEDSVGAWRDAFLRAPYLRDTFVACGVISDTFETAITWDRFPRFPRLGDGRRTRRAVREVCGDGHA